MSKLYRTVGVGANQQTEEVTNEKIRVFANETAIDAALSSLDEDEIVATEDGAESSTRIGNPLGTILAIHSNAVPYGYLPCNGVAFDEHQYPALYALLGDNHTPVEGHGEDWNNAVSIPASSLNNYVCPADGWIVGSFICSALTVCNMYINGVVVAKSSYAISNWQAPACVTMKVNKGDVITVDSITFPDYDMSFVPYKYYKVIKATSGLEETQQDYVLQSLLEADNYSTDEVATGKKWIDGKTIYRKVLTGTSIPSGSFIGEISGFETVIKADGWIKEGSLGNWLPVGYGVVNGNTSNPQMRVDSDSRVYFAVANYTVLKYIVTLEYTKAD